MLTPIKAIRAKCIDCCAGDKLEPKRCTAVKCPLYPYRTGHRPKEYNLSSEIEKAEKTQIAPTCKENTANYEAK